LCCRSKKQEIVYGVVIKVSKTTIELAHNFNSIIPIDTTKIAIKTIVALKHITPIEVNSID